MKKLFSICTLLSLCLTVLAQATSLIVDNQTPGWLSSKINYGDQLSVKRLKVTGYINTTDLKFLGTLITNRELKERLDLSDVNIVAESPNGKDNYLSQNIFDIPTSSSNTITLGFLALPKTVVESNRCLSFVVDTLEYLCNTKGVEKSFIGTSPRHLFIGEQIDSIRKNLDGYESSVFHHNNPDDLTSVHFPKNMRYIGNNAFYNCNNLVFANINDLKNIEYIGENAFRYTKFTLDTLCIPNTIKNKQFVVCSFEYKSGEHIFLGDSITSIFGGSAYSSSRGYTSAFGVPVILHINQMIPPKVTNVSKTWASGSVIYVPKGAKAIWESHPNWTNGWCNSAYMNHAPTIIEENPVESIKLNKNEISLEKNQKETLSASFSPSDADNPAIIWSSKDENIVSVDQNGTITAISSGMTWVYAFNIPTGVKDSCKVTVIQHVTGIKIEPTEITLSKIGETKQLKVEVLPVDATDKTVKWKSSDESVCMVTESGQLIALNSGSATIIAITVDGNFPATCLVTVESTTGINELSSNKIVKTRNGIVVQGMVGEAIKIVNSQGMVVFNKLSSGQKEQIELSKGIYFVKCGVQTTKILL